MAEGPGRRGIFALCALLVGGTIRRMDRLEAARGLSPEEVVYRDHLIPVEEALERLAATPCHGRDDELREGLARELAMLLAFADERSATA